MSRNAVVCVFLGVFWASGCVAEGPETVSASREGVVRGTMETGMREVVAVARFGDMGGLCSGTVLGRFVVLTAKHCVFDDSGRALPASDFLVVVGHDVTSAAGVEHTRAVREIRTTPGSNISSDIENGNDIAILLLGEDVGVTPVRTASRRGPSGGEAITIVGFGRTSGSSEEAGVKYRGTASVSRIGTRIFETTGTSWTCQGDSGGPAFVSSGEVLGITSFGIGGCSTSNSFYTRVDNHLGMIDSALTYVPPCEPETEICDGVDNDCDGVVDNGCTALGDPCTGDGECTMGRCDDVGGAQVCVRDCDPRHAIPRCPRGFYCEVLGCGTGRCILGDPGPKADGEECAADAECASLHCLDVNGTRRCGRSCSRDGEACGTGLLCEAPDGTCGSCVPPELTTGPRPFGAPCESADQCESAMCPDGFCTASCDGATPCGSGFHCRGGTCVRGELGGPGAECVTSEDCDPDFALECVDADGELLCAAPCADGACTTPGFECGPTASGDRCVPPGLPLGAECAANGDCRTGICAGTCTRLCGDLEGCPDGYECRAAGEHSGCFPMPPRVARDGGCSATPSSGTAPGLLALLALAIGVALRRKRE